MRDHEVRNFLFSSSCTVYGAPGTENLPVKETDPIGNCHCPYAKCKYVIECLLQDMARGEPDYWRIIIMRYFNPVGAHESGMIGEDPKGEPQNLMPKLAQVLHFANDEKIIAHTHNIYHIEWQINIK